GRARPGARGGMAHTNAAAMGIRAHTWVRPAHINSTSSWPRPGASARLNRASTALRISSSAGTGRSCPGDIGGIGVLAGADGGVTGCPRPGMLWYNHCRNVGGLLAVSSALLLLPAALCESEEELTVCLLCDTCSVIVTWEPPPKPVVSTSIS